MKKLFCLFLCVVVLLPTAVFFAHAQSGESGTLRLIAYNVSGIPLVGDFQGTVFTTTNDRARRIGKLLNGDFTHKNIPFFPVMHRRES